MTSKTKTDMWRAMRTAAAIIALATGIAATARAQSAAGSIVGSVADEQSAALPGVTLTTRNVDTGALQTTVSDAEGRYRITGLPPGTYQLTSDLSGFAPATVTGIELSIGKEVRQDLGLRLSGVELSVTVQAEARQIEVTRADVSALVTQQQIETLPVAGRSAITLSLLLPGTATDSTRPERPGANVGSGGISTAATNYIVDGLNNMISMAGDAREDVPQSAVREFKVHTAQTPAEFGGRSGGVVNVVTKSGTNQLHGELFEFFRHKHLNALNVFQEQRRDQFGERKPDFRRNQYGVAVGGPVVRNRAHFFVAIDRTRIEDSFQVNTGRPEFYGSNEGVFEGGSFANLTFVKGDVQISNRQRLSIRGSRQSTKLFSEGGGGRNSSFRNDNQVPGFTYFGNHTWQVSDRILNEFAGLYAESTQSYPPGQYAPASHAAQGGSVQYSFPSFAWGVAGGTAFSNQYFQFRNALSIATSRHVWKIGVGAQVLPTYIDTPGNPGTWTFGTDQYFNPNDPAFNFASLSGPIQFQASFPDNHTEVRNHTYEAYVQDEWRIGSDVTLNLGLRYDLQLKVLNEYFEQSRYPRPLPFVDFAARGDRNNVAPRAGLAWDVGGRGRSVVRAGYGLVYGNLQNGIARGEHQAFAQYSVNIRNPSYPDPYNGRDPGLFVSTAPPNITIAANDIENPESHTVNAGLSQELGNVLSLHVDGIYTRQLKFPVSVAINTPDPGTGQRPLPEWGIIRQVQKSDGAYDYRTLLVRLQRRYARNYQYMLSYTLAKQDAAFRPGAHFGTVTDSVNPSFDEGPTDNDRRHGFVASGSFRLPGEVSLGAIWTLRSSRPFSAQAGRDLNGDGSNNDYVPGTTRNQGNRGLDLGLVNGWRAANGLGAVSADQIDSDRFNRFDVRASRSFGVGAGRRVEVIGQVFNLFGTDNLAGIPAENTLSNSFGRILEAQPRQQAELAVKFLF